MVIIINNNNSNNNNSSYYANYNNNLSDGFCLVFQNAPYDPAGYQLAKKKHAAGLAFAKNQVKSHRQEADFDNPRDYIDFFLKEQKKREADPMSQFTGKQAMLLLIVAFSHQEDNS